MDDIHRNWDLKVPEFDMSSNTLLKYWSKVIRGNRFDLFGEHWNPYDMTKEHRHQVWAQVCRKIMSHVNSVLKEEVLEAANLIWEKGGIDHVHNGAQIWREAMAADELGVVYWLHTLGEIDHHAQDDEAWWVACYRGQWATINWLLCLGIPKELVQQGRQCSEFTAKIIDTFKPEPYNMNLIQELRAKPLHPARQREYWIKACRKGNLHKVQMYWNMGEINTQTCIAGWRAACWHGHLEVARWIMDQEGEPMPVNTVFFKACTTGVIAAVETLLQLGADLHQSHDRAWRIACAHGNLRTARMLWRKGGIDHHVLQDWAWRAACVRGHLEVARWIWSLGGVDPNARDGYVWRMACPEPGADVWKLYSELAGPDPEERYIAELCRTIMRDGMIWRSHPCHCHPTLIAWLLELGITSDLVEESREVASPEIATIIDSHIPARRAKSARSTQYYC